MVSRTDLRSAAPGRDAGAFPVCSPADCSVSAVRCGGKKSRSSRSATGSTASAATRSREQASIAIRHGLSIQHLQDIVGINFELSVNQWVAAHEWLAQILDYYYATLHFVVTLGVLVLAVRAAPAHLSRRAHGAVHPDAHRARRLRAVPGRAAAAAARLRLHRHRDQVPHVGLAGRSRDRGALQPVRGDAEPAHRLGDVGRHLGLHVRTAVVGAPARPDLPVLHGARDHRHREPLRHRRRRRRRDRGHRVRHPGGAVRPRCVHAAVGRARLRTSRPAAAEPASVASGGQAASVESARRTRPRRPCARAARRAGSRRSPRPGRTRRHNPARCRRRPAPCPATGSGPRPCRARA